MVTLYINYSLERNTWNIILWLQYPNITVQVLLSVYGCNLKWYIFMNCDVLLVGSLYQWWRSTFSWNQVSWGVWVCFYLKNVLNCVAPAVQFKFSCSYFYQKVNFTQMQLLSWFDFCFLSFLLFLFLSQSLLKNTVFVNFSYWCCRIMSQAVMLYINLSQVDRFCLFRTLLILT